MCEDKNIVAVINNAVDNPNIIEPFNLSETTDFVYHGTSSRSAQKILSCGKLLSAVNVYGKTGGELSDEKNGSLYNDPA